MTYFVYAEYVQTEMKNQFSFVDNNLNELIGFTENFVNNMLRKYHMAVFD